MKMYYDYNVAELGKLVPAIKNELAITEDYSAKHALSDDTVKRFIKGHLIDNETKIVTKEGQRKTRKYHPAAFIDNVAGVDCRYM